MDRFVVGSGRCGSTLLSRMLDAHPDVVSIFEFFTGLDVMRRFSAELDASTLVSLLGAEQGFVTAALRRGHTAEEIVYPFGEPGMRYGREDPLPWLCVAMAPRMSRDPDTLFDEILAWAAQRPPAPAGVQYRALFDWLAQKQGTTHWIERSGSSVDYAESLAACFPEARFLHLHRSGPETALSMREHGIYRLPIAMLYDVEFEAGKTISQSGGFDLGAPAREDDLIARVLRAKLPPGLFGRYWSDQVTRGAVAAQRVGPDRFVSIRFEDLIDRPADTLREIAGFFALEPREDWIEAAAGLVRGRPRPRLPALSTVERSVLEEACAPGAAAIEDFSQP
ncbi:MAG: sulfotransferase [bacterium]|nr:hypothetical protein [Deltaproteobacteria bacterium]MCP4908422.1 sulfotransferase [bacterium]